MKYKFLEYTADIKFVAFGKDIEEGYQQKIYEELNEYIMGLFDLTKTEKGHVTKCVKMSSNSSFHALK